MRRAAGMILAMAFAAIAARGQQSGDPGAFLETAAARDSYYVGEAIDVTIRLAFDAAFFRDAAIQTSRRQLEVPVAIDAPWLLALPGVTALEDVPDDGGRPRRRITIALNGEPREVVRGTDRTLFGRTYQVVQIERRVAAEAPGRLVIPGPTARYTYGTRFDEDLVGGRVPVERREATIRADDLVLTILPLPETDRPPAFGGAVGRFDVRAEASPRTIAAGESLKLTITIRGTGNLASFDPPRLEALEGFHVYGVIDARGATVRVLTYDVAPGSEAVTSVPPIAFAYFDPVPPAQYRIARTEPIPITVRARTFAPAEPVPASVPPPVATPGVDDLHPVAAVGAARAERAYASGRYEEALTLFQARLDEPDAPRGLVLYDMGNCHARLGRDAEALLRYRQAQLHAPHDERLAFNVGLIERQLGVPGRPRSGLFDWMGVAARSFTLREQLAIGAGILAAGLGCAALSRRRGLRGASLALALIGALLAGRAAGRLALPAPREAIVIAGDAPLRTEPHLSVKGGPNLRPGETVVVEEMSDRWARITLPRGGGWIESSRIAVVE